MTLSNWFILTGIAIILALAIYATILWRQVRRKSEAQRTLQLEREERLAADIEFLAQSLSTGQLPPIEGAIRIKVLLDNYSGPRREVLDVAVFEEVYDATAHIPTHKAWKDLPLAQRKIHEGEMAAIERSHKVRLENAAAQLREGLASAR